MRVSFDKVFKQNPNGSYTPKSRVKIGGVMMGPGVAFTPGVVFSGVDIGKYAGKDLEVQKHSDGTVEVKGVCQ